MFDSVKTAFGRRDLFRRGGMLAAAQALLGGSRPANAAAPAVAGKLRLGPDIYQSIGVRPLINCRGTLTVISGSLELPEVRAAVDAGGQHHVVLDELMEGVARRLAELTATSGPSCHRVARLGWHTPPPRASRAGIPTCTFAFPT